MIKKLDKATKKCSSSCTNTFCRLLEPKTKADLCKIALRVQYETRQVFELETGQGGKLMLLDKGQVIPSRFRKDGRQKGIECLGEGEIIGLSQLSSREELTRVSVYVKENMEGCLFPVTQFQQLCNTHSNLATEVISNLSRRFATAIDQLECMTLGNGEERILYLVEYLGTHHLEDSLSVQTVAFTHEELALLAGINRVTATRAIDHLKQSGVLTTSRGKLRVL